LEHCICNDGSKKFNKESDEYFRNYMGVFTAQTTIARTFFIGEMLSENLPDWLKYISSNVFNPEFSIKTFKGEKKRVLREIADNKSDEEFEALVKLDNIFYRTHPAGIDLLRGEKIVKDATLENLISFYRRGYFPNNADLILVGGLPKNTEELIEENFGKFKPGINTRRVFPELKPLKAKSVLSILDSTRINNENPLNSSAKVLIRYNGPTSWEKDDYSTKVMNRILGNSGKNSLLFKKLGLEKGLAYYISASEGDYYNAGHLEIEAIVPAEKIIESVLTIFGEMDKMKKEKVDKRKIEAIVKRIKFETIDELESNKKNIEKIEFFLDKGVSVEDVFRGFEDVTPESILDVSNKYLPDMKKGKYILYTADPFLEEDEE
jgi:zinc protease